MADTQQQRQQHYNQFNHPTTSDTTIFPSSSSSSSASQLLPLAIILPLGGLLLVLSGVTLALTRTGIVVTARLFVIFSPVLLPAVLAVAGFLTAGAFGVTGISSFAWLAGYLRGSRWPERLEHAKRRAGEVVGHVAKRTKKAAESAVSKSQEVGQTGQSKARDDGKAQEQEMGQKEKRKAREERRARKSESSGFYATAG